MRTVRSVHSPATGAMPCGRRHRRRAGSLRNWTHPWSLYFCPVVSIYLSFFFYLIFLA